MRVKASYSIDQLRDYASLFTRGEALSWLNNDFTSMDSKIRRYESKTTTNRLNRISYLRFVYRVLQEHYRNEYVYKNQLLNQQIMEEIGKADSVVFNEFRLVDAIADFAMFNGTSKAFEIKTELDKDERLNGQISAYRKLFNEIYLVVPEERKSKYLDFDNEIGLIVYEKNAKSFAVVRKPNFNSKFCPAALMNVLHTREYCRIAEQYLGSLEKVSSFERFDVCRNLFRKLPPSELSGLFIKTMKERQMNTRFFHRKFEEFNQLCLSLKLNENRANLMLRNLKADFTE